MLKRAVLLSACALAITPGRMLAAPPAPEPAAMATAHDPAFVGTWRKRTGNACAARYPATLRFDANGIYAGQAEQPGEFTWWDSGTWKVVGSGELAVSVANDAVERYAFKLEGDALTFTDGQGCVFGYEREA